MTNFSHRLAVVSTVDVCFICGRMILGLCDNNHNNDGSLTGLIANPKKKTGLQHYALYKHWWKHLLAKWLVTCFLRPNGNNDTLAYLLCSYKHVKLVGFEIKKARVYGVLVITIWNQTIEAEFSWGWHRGGIKHEMQNRCCEKMKYACLTMC